MEGINSNNLLRRSMYFAIPFLMHDLLPGNYYQLSPSEAVALQKELYPHVTLRPLPASPKTIAGADISFDKYSEVIYAGIVVMSFPELKILHSAFVITKTTFPYMPGLLAFRELPALLEVWNTLETKPDVLVLDGHGIAHPRRLGIASHFGILTGASTIGCGKTLLAGSYTEPADETMATSELMYKDEMIGTVLRTKAKCKPVIISPGNLITMDESVDIISRCVTRYRIPEPTRRAHLLVNKLRISNKKNG